MKLYLLAKTFRLFSLGYGQNVPMPKRTQPKRTQFWSKRTHFFGQNVPSPPKRTQPFGQNVPNIFFPDIQYIFYFFCRKKIICTLV